jgi:hypothetical protein
MYHLVRFDDGGSTLTVLATAPTEDAADSKLDVLCSQFPHAHIDILSSLELRRAEIIAMVRPIKAAIDRGAVARYGAISDAI